MRSRLGNSDHTMILATVQTTFKSIKSVERVPNWNKAVWTHLKREAGLRNWTRATKDLSANEAWDMVKTDLKDLVSTLVPNKPRRNRNRPPWMTQHILREIRKRMRKTKKDSKTYEEQSRLVKNMIRNAKRKLERRLAEGGGGNNRPFTPMSETKQKTELAWGP